MPLFKTTSAREKGKPAECDELVRCLFAVWDPCTLSAAHGPASALAYTLSNRDQHMRAHMPGAVFTACGRGAVQQPHPPHRASASKPAAPAATLALLLFVLVFGEEDGGSPKPHVLCGSAAHVDVHVSSSGGKVVVV